MTAPDSDELDAETLAELHRLARSRPTSGRARIAKLGAIRTLERLGRRAKPGSPDADAVARLFDERRDPGERVREDDWHPNPGSEWVGLDMTETVESRRRWYLSLRRRA